MKIKAFFSALCILFAFSACSDKEDSINIPEAGEKKQFSSNLKIPNVETCVQMKLQQMAQALLFYLQLSILSTVRKIR